MTYIYKVGDVVKVRANGTGYWANKILTIIGVCTRERPNTYRLEDKKTGEVVTGSMEYFTLYNPFTKEERVIHKIVSLDERWAQKKLQRCRSKPLPLGA